MQLTIKFSSSFMKSLYFFLPCLFTIDLHNSGDTAFYFLAHMSVQNVLFFYLRL